MPDEENRPNNDRFDDNQRNDDQHDDQLRAARSAARGGGVCRHTFRKVGAKRICSKCGLKVPIPRIS